ncbi:MAG: hypothetical protein HN353_07240 [Bdellovibrionales bacterium]|jgi:hypothetical protein|nr:hypothetical protein [Bdellovibrionales bacterium]MBT3526604.1 hypothetical protein [Bdellovibrionales bacterium]MBT7668041.1 hypothetical protein [Bdellovibrionales bacterium]
MKKILMMGLLIALFSNAVNALECSAVKRETTTSGTQVSEMQLDQKSPVGGIERFAGDIGLAHFSVQLDGSTATAMITIGPDYTLGNLSKGRLAEDGKLKLAFVTPNITFILNCQE